MRNWILKRIDDITKSSFRDEESLNKITNEFYRWLSCYAWNSSEKYNCEIDIPNKKEIKEILIKINFIRRGLIYYRLVEKMSMVDVSKVLNRNKSYLSSLFHDTIRKNFILKSRSL